MHLRHLLPAIGLLLMAPPLPAAPASVETHARALLEALDDDPFDAQGLARAHFTQRLIGERGIDDIAGIVAMLREDLVPVRIQRVSSTEDGAVALHLDSGGMGPLEFQVRSGPGPHFRIDRFALRPVAGKLPDRAQLAADPAVAIEELVEAHVAATGFSGAVLVARGDKVLYGRAFGLADVAAGRANTLDTPINLGSMNKMFTGVAIAQLEQRGLLGYDDTVGEHLPDYPDAQVRENVTVHQLLTHTSGLGSYWNEKYERRKRELDSVGEFAELFAGEPLAFEPGSQFSYSNNGPVVLGLIIERITGQDYYGYVREHIYEPARMTHSGHFLITDTGAGFALGYMASDEEAVANTDGMGLRGSPAGGGYASANDMLRFARALLDGRLLSAESVATLTGGKVDMGPGMRYAYLFGDHQEHGLRFFGHNGGAPGISAEFSVYPESSTVLIVLANQDRAAAGLARKLRGLIAAYLQ